jgi:hypothetical protein
VFACHRLFAVCKRSNKGIGMNYYRHYAVVVFVTIISEDLSYFASESCRPSVFYNIHESLEHLNSFRISGLI